MGTSRTFSIHFWLNQSKKNGDLAPIYARITVDGRRCEISLKRQTSVTYCANNGQGGILWAFFAPKPHGP